jgi:hypothetical protein
LQKHHKKSARKIAYIVLLALPLEVALVKLTQSSLCIRYTIPTKISAKKKITISPRYQKNLQDFINTRYKINQDKLLNNIYHPGEYIRSLGKYTCAFNRKVSGEETKKNRIQEYGSYLLTDFYTPDLGTCTTLQ